MHDATSPRPQLRLAIAPGVASSNLAALLALQRAEEPDVSMEFNEVTTSDLITGLYKRRFDVGLSLKQVSDSSLKSLLFGLRRQLLPRRCDTHCSGSSQSE